jgi:hypothetical protein
VRLTVVHLALVRDLDLDRADIAEGAAETFLVEQRGHRIWPSTQRAACALNAVARAAAFLGR